MLENRCKNQLENIPIDKFYGPTNFYETKKLKINQINNENFIDIMLYHSTYCQL